MALLTRVVRAGAGGLSLTEAAAEVGVSVSTAHRLLRALVRAGYARQDGRSERYLLGPMAAVAGQAAVMSLGLEPASAVVADLADRSGETASLGLLDGDAVLILIEVSAAQTLRVERGVGARVPAHASAIGKALLARWPDEGPRLGSCGPLERFTPHTLTEPEALAAQLAEVGRSGIAINVDERYLGASAVAAAVDVGSYGMKVAVGVQLPTARLDQARRKELGELVRAAATDLGSLPVLGGPQI